MAGDFDWSKYGERPSGYFGDATTYSLPVHEKLGYIISSSALPPRARGFDTSYWNHGPAGAQSPIDFQAAYFAGYSFWIGRLTRGQKDIDTWIERDYQAASQTPLVKCVYHVLYPGEPVGPHIENLRRGLALLPETPKAIALDLERGAEFGAAAVTSCLVDTVWNLWTFWDGIILLYSNDNYLKNYIRNRCGLEIWLADPDNNDDLALYNPVILQSSWVHAIPGVPDPTNDYDEFMGDELQMFAYFAADEPEPEPEDNVSALDALKIAFEQLSNVSDTIQGILINMNNAIAEAEGQPEPPAPPPPTPPPPAPANVRNFYIDPADDKPRANARFIRGWNNAEPSRPIFEIYPSDSSTAAERQQFNAGVTVQVEGDAMKGDSGVTCYQLYDPESRYKARPLFIRKDDGSLV